MMSLMLSRASMLVTRAAAGRSVLAACRFTHAAPSEQPATVDAEAKRVNVYKLSEADLTTLMDSWGEPSYRTGQIRSWVYDKCVTSFDSLKDLPTSLRERLNDYFCFGDLEIAKELVSKDGTRKRAYKLADGHIIESVLMPYRDNRFTACISSQVGCGMGCVFCATGQMGFKRQLSTTEIVEQVQRFNALLKPEGGRVTHVVFMGMGEPFANYSNVMAAVERINKEIGIAARRITISTSGIVPRIRQLADSGLQVGLAVSLHAANDEARSKLMPVNNRYPLSELMAACRYYVGKTNRRITFEWALIEGQTDKPQIVHELGQLLQPLHCHVNVIPLNPTKGFKGMPSQRGAVKQFVDILGRYHVPATPRVRRGIDISAGCGQLTEKVMQEQGKQENPKDKNYHQNQKAAAQSPQRRSKTPRQKYQPKRS